MGTFGRLAFTFERSVNDEFAGAFRPGEWTQPPPLDAPLAAGPLLVLPLPPLEPLPPPPLTIPLPPPLPLVDPLPPPLTIPLLPEELWG